MFLCIFQVLFFTLEISGRSVYVITIADINSSINRLLLEIDLYLAA